MSIPIMNIARKDEDIMLTETQRINLIRDRVQEECSKGNLGVLAARSKVPEGDLYAWVKDPTKVPLYSELIEIQAALGEQVIIDAAEEYND